MLSHCTICGTPTDLALSDVLSADSIEQLGGVQEVPLIGTCGEPECVAKQTAELGDEPEDLTHYNDERDDQRDEWDGGPDNIKDERI